MILDRLGKELIYFDGGTGTLLQERGLKPGELPETWSLERADDMIDIARQYYEAGSDIVLSNTFGANALKFHDSRHKLDEIVKAAIENNIEIIPIPGACAAINALISSGMKTNEFIFIGFLPVNIKEKKEKLAEIKKYTQTIILYEAPHKLINTLKMMLEEIGDRNICLAREITKIHEEHIRGKISEILEKINEPKGEYVLILEGNNKSEKEEKREILNEMSLEEHFEYYKKQGFDKKEIIKKIAKDRNTNKNEIYQYFLK